MILVTGAAGKTGLAVIGALAARGRGIRALVRHESQGQLVQDHGASEWLAGDMGHVDMLSRAMEGIQAVYHIAPNVNPYELRYGETAMEAAREKSVPRFVYHSVLHPQIEAMPHHWLKMRVEEALIRSGLNFTILQPAVYMQNVLAAREEIRDAGTYTVPYAAETRLGMVDLSDVAEAAAIVLTQAGHEGAVYGLSGPDILNQYEIADKIGRAAGKTVRVRRQSIEIWQRSSRNREMNSYQIEALSKMFLYYERFGFRGSSRILGWLLGRAPTDFMAFCRREFSGLLAR